MSTDLKTYAVTEQNSQGRAFPQPPHKYRGQFDRDRDRIIHCSAFRRLEGKTQVFTPGLDDHYRTRLTHTIEVAQIGRTIAKALDVNESLTEAICLAHDLGHGPFGHCGESILNEIMENDGGFEHNFQSLRIVDFLEHPYNEFAGLNLMYETRLALAKHQSPYDKAKNYHMTENNCSIEGQIADLADRIAYNCHDLDDGIRAGIIAIDQPDNIELFANAKKQINANKITDWTIKRTRITKKIIDDLVSNCIEQSKTNIKQAGIKTLGDIYNHQTHIINFNDKTEIMLRQLEKFLYDNFYMHQQIRQMANKIDSWLKKLFDKIRSKPELMPHYFQRMIETQTLNRTVCDYIAGMTDQYCLKTLEKPSKS